MPFTRPKELGTEAILAQLWLNIANAKRQPIGQTITQAETTKLVTLDNGDTVSKVEFDKLAPENQAVLKQLGVDKFNELQKTEIANELAKYVEVGKGELVLKSKFDALDRNSQALLKELKELRWQAQQRLWQEGPKDTLLLKDIEDAETAFRTADAETARRIG